MKYQRREEIRINFHCLNTWYERINPSFNYDVHLPVDGITSSGDPLRVVVGLVPIDQWWGKYGHPGG